MSRLRRVAAFLGLAVSVAGLPVLLRAAAGPPSLAGLPTWEWLRTSLHLQYMPLDPLLRLLALLAWALWAYLALVSVLRMLALAAARLHVAGAGLLLATTELVTLPRLRHLVDAAVGMSLLASTVGQPPTAAPTRPAPAAVREASIAAPAAAPPAWERTRALLRVAAPPTAVPAAGQDGDGDGSSHPPLPPPDPRPPATTANPAAAHAGSHLHAGAHARPTVTYTVQPGDSLWRIAEKRLGDPLRWHEIWALNRGRDMGGGRIFHRAGLILPGWVLLLPAPPSPPAPAPPAAASAPAPSQPPMTAPPPTTTPTAPTPRAPTADEDAQQAQQAQQAHQPPPAAPAHQTAGRHRPAIRLPDGGVVGPSLAAAITAALTLAFLHRRRRQRLSDPQPGLHHTDPLVTPAVRRLVRATTGADQADGQTDGQTDGADARSASKPPSSTASGGSGSGIPLPPGAGAGASDGIVEIAHAGRQHEQAEAAPDGGLDVGLRVDLAAGGLGLVGPSALPAARAILTALLGATRPDTSEALVAGPALASKLLGDPTPRPSPFPGLTIAADLDAALTTLEVELLHRTRLLGHHGIADVAAYADFDPAEPLPTLVLVADLLADDRGQPHSYGPRLEAVLRMGRRLGIGAILLGPNPAGPTVTGDQAGAVTALRPDGALPELLGARLYVLGVEEAGELLRVIAAGRGAEPGAGPEPEPEPEPEPGGGEPQARQPESVPLLPAAAMQMQAASEPTAKPASGQAANQADQAEAAGEAEGGRLGAHAQPAGTAPPVEVRVLGPLQLLVNGRQLAKGLRSHAYELLAYLLLHPSGVTREQAIEALWPEIDPDRGVQWFKAVLGNLRRVLRPATDLDLVLDAGVDAGAATTGTGVAVIARVVDRYQANPDLVSCDLWRLQHALARAVATADPAGKTQALQQALAAYQGDLLDGADYQWALTEREDLRRQAVNAAGRLAALHEQAGDHDRALDVLDQAVRWDPYKEELYERIMRLHARLGRPDEVRRTFRRLELRMAELDDDPTDAARRLRLRDELLRASP